MRKFLSFALILMLIFSIAIPVSAAAKPPAEIKVDGVSVSAKVDQLKGLQNRLWITLTDANGTVTKDFMIKNNAEGVYTINTEYANSTVYVNTKGNTQIRACYLVSYSVIKPKYTADSVKPGKFIVENPTLINLGFEWFIEGDANRNATVEVSYRKVGDTEWKQGLDLLRIGGERIWANNRMDVILPPMFAGSIMDLDEDTAYECKFVMKDPDGVDGDSVVIRTVSTRPEPMPYDGGNTYHVYPIGYTGDRIQPAFEGLMAAYNYHDSGTDWATAGRPRVKAGDTIIVHAGLYKNNGREYTNNAAVNRSTPYDGTYYLYAKGTEDKPISIIGAGDGEVIFDGNGNETLFNLMVADYHYFEGLTIRNSDYGIKAGIQYIAGCKGLTVKNCRFEDVGNGIWTNNSRSENFYIADNYFIGRNDPDHVIGWSGAFWEQFNGVDGQKFPPPMDSYCAVKVYGPGHVMCYNYVEAFHDGIDVETYGNPDGSDQFGPNYPTEDYYAVRPNSIDYYNNYMTNFHDNPFEADGSLHNLRIFRNLMLNQASHAYRNQPVNGGPVYWIGNISYHSPNNGGGAVGVLGGSSGHYFFNNTITAEVGVSAGSNTHFRNNLILPQNTMEWIFSNNTYCNYDTSDYNGFCPNEGVAVSFRWNSPEWGVMQSMNGPGQPAQLVTRTFATLEEYQAGTGQDLNSILVDYDVFVNVPRLDAKDISKVQYVYKFEDMKAVDFRLKPNSVAVDAGVAIPNVTDGYIGDAPDLGALEVGKPMPIFGPRTNPVPQPGSKVINHSVAFRVFDGNYSIGYTQLVKDGESIDWDAVDANYPGPLANIEYWLDDETGNILWNKNIPIFKNMILFPKYFDVQPVYHNVGFRVFDGSYSIGYTQKVKDGESIDWDAVAANYPGSLDKLQYWCNDATGTPLWDINIPITEDMVFFPKYL